MYSQCNGAGISCKRNMLRMYVHQRFEALIQRLYIYFYTDVLSNIIAICRVLDSLEINSLVSECSIFIHLEVGLYHDADDTTNQLPEFNEIAWSLINRLLLSDRMHIVAVKCK